MLQGNYRDSDPAGFPGVYCPRSPCVSELWISTNHKRRFTLGILPQVLPWLLQPGPSLHLLVPMLSLNTAFCILDPRRLMLYLAFSTVTVRELVKLTVGLFPIECFGANMGLYRLPAT